MGVDLDAYRTGIGGALVRSGLERCDRDGAHTYLECLVHLVPH
jgi:predicted N-acetyltransferase YhbS